MMLQERTPRLMRTGIGPLACVLVLWLCSSGKFEAPRAPVLFYLLCPGCCAVSTPEDSCRIICWSPFLTA